MGASSNRKAQQCLASKLYRARNKDLLAEKAKEIREIRKVVENYNKLPNSSPPSSPTHSDFSRCSLPRATSPASPRATSFAGSQARSPEPAATHRPDDRHQRDEAGRKVLREFREGLQDWTKDLGPVDQWGKKFREGYDSACADDTTGRSTQDAIDVFLERVEEHAEVGRRMLVRLMKSSIVQPPETHEAWGDFLLVNDSLAVVHRGIAVLEARLDICAPEGAHQSELLSTTRRHVGFEGML